MAGWPAPKHAMNESIQRQVCISIPTFNYSYHDKFDFSFLFIWERWLYFNQKKMKKQLFAAAVVPELHARE